MFTSVQKQMKKIINLSRSPLTQIISARLVNFLPMHWNKDLRTWSLNDWRSNRTIPAKNSSEIKPEGFDTWLFRFQDVFTARFSLEEQNGNLCLTFSKILMKNRVTMKWSLHRLSSWKCWNDLVMIAIFDVLEDRGR